MSEQVEWGLRNPLGNVLLCTGEAAAREHADRYGEVVQIVTRTVTPWEPLTAGEARSRWRHDWQPIGDSQDWQLYECRDCRWRAFPLPFGLMPFWKRCSLNGGPTSETIKATDGNAPTEQRGETS